MKQYLHPVEELDQTADMPNDKGKLPAWTNLFKNNKSAENGMALSYIPPQIVDGHPIVQLEKAEVVQETLKWRCALIAYFIGVVPGYNVMRRFVNQNWAQDANPDLYLHDEGYYVIKFQTIEDLNAVYYSGPYSINNRPIILKPRTPEFDFNTEFPTEIPLWVKFPNLPMNGVATPLVG